MSNDVRRLREMAAMTQAELGERVGATRQTIIAIEAEKYAPSLELAFKLARVFKRLVDDVFRFDAGG